MDEVSYDAIIIQVSMFTSPKGHEEDSIVAQAPDGMGGGSFRVPKGTYRPGDKITITLTPPSRIARPQRV